MHDATHGASEPEHDFDPIAERFFSQPPEPRELAHDDWRPEPLSSLQRIAMLTTVAPAMALLAVAITLLASEPMHVASAKQAARESPIPALESIAPEMIERAPEEREPIAPAPALPVLAAPAAQASAQRASAQPAPPARAARAARAKAAPRRAKPSSGAKRARQLLDAGDAAGARDLAREAVRKAPDRAAGYIVLATALDELGDRAGKAATFRSCAQHATDGLASACKALARER